MNNYLFLFTIGPVQTFIAQARKTQDLYAGSKLLSDLINSAIKEFEDAGGKVLFPSKKLESKPNRFLGDIETDNPQRLGKELENWVKKKFGEKIEKALKNANVKKPNGFDKQIEDFLQIYWVALEYEEENYWKKYKEIKQYLGAIKNVRSFEQIPETGRKCSLCGERNVLFCEKGNKSKVQLKPDWKNLSEEDKKVVNDYNNSITEISYPFGISEGLCAVCFTKRFYEKEHFPSTAEICLMNKIPKNEIKLFKSLNLDPQLFYEKNLTKEYFEKFQISESLDKVKKLKNQILERCKLKSSDLLKYYALIMLDGDNMGKWLSGEFLKDKDKLKEFHIKISKELGNYADKMNNLISQPKGKLVYAGGDDVMAFVNLEHLFEVLKNLRKEFPKFENLGFALQNDKKSSVSAGVVIAHYKTPLPEVLKWARKMEKSAKEKGGRDAFAIAVLKHSGEIQETVWKWKTHDIWVIDRLKELVNELNDKNEGFSNTFIKNINIEFSKLGEIDDEMFKTELKRLLKRSSQIKNDKDEKKKKVEEWTDKLIPLYYEAGKIENFFAFLNIADFLVRRTTQ